MFPASWRWFACWDLCHLGLAFRQRHCLGPCAPTKKRVPESFALSSRPASGKLARTTPCLFMPSSASFISPRASLLRAASCREGAMAEAAAPVKGTRPEGAVSEADALRLPFASASFDLVTSAFGFRNLANYEAGLREMQRVLEPGGTIAILEFTEPPDGFLGDFYRWYFCKVLPRIGGLISGEQAAYKYLPNSVARFFRPPELAELMRAVGYQSVDYRVWTLGTVALHTAIRPPN